VDSVAINKAIDAAAKAGGGTVFLSAGTYRSFSIRLKSNVGLYLDHGATIMAADPKDGAAKYDPPEPNSVGAVSGLRPQPLAQQSDLGREPREHLDPRSGKIWAKAWCAVAISRARKSRMTRIANVVADPKAAPFGYPNPRDAVEPGWGNKAISLKLCRNVIIRDVSILHGGHFAILATGVDNLTIDNVKIDTNRDGIDVDACKNVRISNCTVNSPFRRCDLSEEFLRARRRASHGERDDHQLPG
jgi:polygalacturonase